MGSFIGLLAGLIAALIFGFLVWLPLFHGNIIVLGTVCFLTGFVLTGLGLIIGSLLED